VRDLKIAAAIGERPEEAKPKRAPFWRSGLTLPAMLANIEGVEAVIAAGISDVMPEREARHCSALAFVSGQAKRTLAALAPDWLATAADAEGHQKLSYALIPLAGAIRVVGESYPQALGLTLGFNSLDGD